MNKSIRHSFMALSVLASACAVASCGAEASSEPEIARLDAELRSVRELAVDLEALADEAPDPAMDCDCGPLVSWPPPSCMRPSWFCNAVGDCTCEVPSGSAVLETATEVVTRARTLSSDPGAPAGGATVSSSSGLSALREVRQDLGAADGLPLRDGSDDADCKCLGATVSPPQGGCALVDWFCNASGLCRCRS